MRNRSPPSTPHRELHSYVFLDCQCRGCSLSISYIVESAYRHQQGFVIMSCKGPKHGNLGGKLGACLGNTSAA